VPLIQGIQIGFYAWTLVWCIDLMVSSPCCTWKPINDNTQHPKLQRNSTYNVSCYGITVNLHGTHKSIVKQIVINRQTKRS